MSQTWYPTNQSVTGNGPFYAASEPYAPPPASSPIQSTLMELAKTVSCLEESIAALMAKVGTVSLPDEPQAATTTVPQTAPVQATSFVERSVVCEIARINDCDRALQRVVARLRT